MVAIYCYKVQTVLSQETKVTMWTEQQNAIDGPENPAGDE